MKHPGTDAVRKIFSNASLAACLALGTVGTLWAVAGQRATPLIYDASAMLVVAVALEWREVYVEAAAPPARLGQG
jgi:hypothetical protein